MSTINDLKGIFNSGPARSNRYRLLMPDNAEQLNILCDAVTLPGRSIVTHDYYNHMRNSKRAYAYGFEDITISFILENNWIAWNFLNDWQKLVITELDEDNANNKLHFREEYEKTIIIETLNIQNETTKTVTIHRAFPISLAQIDLSNQTSNEIIKCSAVFAYENWTD